MRPRLLWLCSTIFPDDVARKSEIFEYLLLPMNDRNRVALRELAWRQVQRLATPPAPHIQPVKLPLFNAACGRGPARRPALEEILANLIREGKLPLNLQPAPPQQRRLTAAPSNTRPKPRPARGVRKLLPRSRLRACMPRRAATSPNAASEGCS